MTNLQQWRALEFENSQMIDAQYAEDWAHFPMKAPPNGEPIPDTTRAPYSLKMVFDWPAISALDRTDSQMQRTAARNATLPGLAGTDWRLSYDTRTLPHLMKKGDELQRHLDGRRYAITEMRPDGQYRMRLELKSIKQV